MLLAVLSDVHGNLSALEAVLADMSGFDVDACLLLGDLIDYGPRSNEVLSVVSEMLYEVLCNIRGNHEDAILEGRFGRFSSPRGEQSARHTRDVLSEASRSYLLGEMSCSGKAVLDIEDMRVLCVHGSVDDEYWGTIVADDGIEGYDEYDFVFSGHSHRPHLFARYHEVDDALMRNEGKTVFINPGSVGQPRNHCPFAQYVLVSLPVGSVDFRRVPYDVEYERSFYDGSVDAFYSDRLIVGV